MNSNHVMHIMKSSGWIISQPQLQLSTWVLQMVNLLFAIVSHNPYYPLSFLQLSFHSTAVPPCFSDPSVIVIVRFVYTVSID